MSLEATTGTGMSLVGDFSSFRRTLFEDDLGRYYYDPCAITPFFILIQRGKISSILSWQMSEAVYISYERYVASASSN